MLEQRVLFMALDGLALDEATRTKVTAIRDEFAASVQAYEKDAEVKRKEIFEKRKKSAEPGKPPSEEFKKATYKNIEITDLRAFLQHKLEQMLQQNATRTDFAQRLQQIIDAYNAGGCAPLYQHSSKRPGRSFGMGLAHS
jgi:hypothetical protein